MEKEDNGEGPFVASVVNDVREVVDQLRKEVVDKSAEMRSALERFRGKVFHAVTANNKVLQYRVGLDGKVTLERTIKSLNQRAQKLREARRKLIEAGKAVPIKAQRRWRAVVTGDPNKRIRDHLKEVPQVKMLDKISFTLGVLTICLSEWIVLRHPHFFQMYYYAMMAVLFTTRYIMYKQERYHYFMLDFCYFINVSCIIQTAFYPQNLTWFRTNFALTMGPLIISIVVWQNSLVFHSLDKVTSFFLHAFPPMLCHLFRWRLIHTDVIKIEDKLGFHDGYFMPLLMYLLWQAGYIFLTEFTFLKTELDNDPNLITSLRYLAREKKNGMSVLVNNICRKYGVIGQDEVLEADDTKTKVVFIVTQLLYTLVALIHISLLYGSYYLSCFYMVALFMWATWNGASYYIEVFSKRYNMKFHMESSKTDDEAKPSEEEEEDTAEEDEFVEALENIDLNEPLTMELYNELLEDLVSTSETLEKSKEPSEMDEDDDDGVGSSNNEGIKEDSTVLKELNEESKTFTSEDGQSIAYDVAVSKHPRAVITYYESFILRNKPGTTEIPELIAEAANDEKSSSSSSEANEKWEVVAE